MPLKFLTLPKYTTYEKSVGSFASGSLWMSLTNQKDIIWNNNEKPGPIFRNEIFICGLLEHFVHFHFEIYY